MKPRHLSSYEPWVQVQWIKVSEPRMDAIVPVPGGPSRMNLLPLSHGSWKRTGFDPVSRPKAMQSNKWLKS